MYFHKWLRLTIGFAFLLTLLRIAISNSLNYVFLPWNLLLAYVPLWISKNKLKMEDPLLRKNAISKNIRRFFWFGVWVLFLPNAPYIITDLVHLKERFPIPFYYDIVLVFIHAISGLIFFFISVQYAEKWWQQTLTAWNIYWFYFLAFGLCSFGIYLGRFGRFNSWNIITKPQILFTEIYERIIFPFEYPGTWAVTLLFSALLFLLYQLGKNWQAAVIQK